MSITLFPRALVYDIHQHTIHEHGGAPGVRNEGAIDSALARPENLLAYEDPTLFQLAAAYAYGLSQNHGFVDGNKRVAAVVSTAFLQMNGYRLDVTLREFERVFLALAAGEFSELQLTEWFEENCLPEEA